MVWPAHDPAGSGALEATNHGGKHEAVDAIKELRMFRKTILSSILAACLMLAPMMVRGASDSTGTIGVTVTVDQFAEWADAANNYTISAANFSGHINTVNQTRTATRNLTLYSNIAVTLAATTTSGTPDFSGILTDSSEAYTLTTQYSISGAGITPTNAGLLAPATFFDVTNTYALAHTAGVGSYAVTLTVTAASPATSAPEAGDYTCGLALTATW
jgi:hypothetical protein